MTERKKLLLHEPGLSADWQGCPAFTNCVTLHRGTRAVKIPPANGKAVVLLSGGMDSTTLAYELGAAGWELLLVSVDYGQAHKEQELAAAQRTAERLRHSDGAEYIVVLYPELGELLSSALTDPGAEIPDGHYTDESMAATVVPNRNAILISIAWGIAVAQSATIVATAVHAGDHPIYPDCRPEFIDALNTALRLGTAGHADPVLRLAAPYVDVDKTDIARRGVHARVNWADTWSCYKGDELHCGTCGTCVERREAFTDAGITDPTEYKES